MGDVLFVWTAAYQTCLMRASVPRLLSELYQLFDLCLIKHVSTVRPLTSQSACLVTKQCLMVFGRQTFPVCPGPKTGNKCKFTSSPCICCLSYRHDAIIRSLIYSLSSEKNTYHPHGYSDVSMYVFKLGSQSLFSVATWQF